MYNAMFVAEALHCQLVDYLGLSRRCPCRRPVCPQYARQFLRPYALCPLEPSLDDLEQGSIRNLDLPVGLWVGGGGVVVSDS